MNLKKIICLAAAAVMVTASTALPACAEDTTTATTYGVTETYDFTQLPVTTGSTGDSAAETDYYTYTLGGHFAQAASSAVTSPASQTVGMNLYKVSIGSSKGIACNKNNGKIYFKPDKAGQIKVYFNTNGLRAYEGSNQLDLAPDDENTQNCSADNSPATITVTANTVYYFCGGASSNTNITKLEYSHASTDVDTYDLTKVVSNKTNKIANTYYTYSLAGNLTTLSDQASIPDSVTSPASKTIGIDNGVKMETTGIFVNKSSGAVYIKPDYAGTLTVSYSDADSTDTTEASIRLFKDGSSSTENAASSSTTEAVYNVAADSVYKITGGTSENVILTNIVYDYSSSATAVYTTKINTTPYNESDGCYANAYTFTTTLDSDDSKIKATAGEKSAELNVSGLSGNVRGGIITIAGSENTLTNAGDPTVTVE